MKIQYFRSAWEDIKHSPGWFGKLCLLALVNFIPVFGGIVTAGYLYGWAREIAWGAHEPMPARLFANEDGKFWRRGWCIFLLCFLFGLIPTILISIANSIETTSVVMTFYGFQTVNDPAMGALSTLLSVIGILVGIVALLASWVGGMRVAIYDRLSAGFQFGKIWKMYKHDVGGLWRIFGMYVLMLFICAIVITIIAVFMVMIVVMVGLGGLLSAGYTIDSLQHAPQSQMVALLVQFVLSAGLIGFILIFLLIFVCMFIGVLVYALAIRAMGYWTMQFDVARWGGQDDPMPFELETRPPVDVPPTPPVVPAQAPSSSATPGAPVAPTVPPSVTPMPAEQGPIDPPMTSAEPQGDPTVLTPDQTVVAVEAVEAQAAQGSDLSHGLEVTSAAQDSPQVRQAREAGVAVAADEPLPADQAFTLTAEEVEVIEDGGIASEPDPEEQD